MTNVSATSILSVNEENDKKKNGDKKQEQASENPLLGFYQFTFSLRSCRVNGGVVANRG